MAVGVSRLLLTLPVRLLLLLAALLGGACADGVLRPQNLGKSDIDFVIDAHYRESQGLLETLTRKLYRRNPVQLTRGLVGDIDARIAQLFSHSGPLDFKELDHARGAEAMEKALDPNYTGDRIFALMAGLADMIRRSYQYKSDFYMFDQLDQQQLYNSARNVEILMWRVSRPQSEGKLLILTNSRPGEPANLSFERLFGKLIAGQDMLARIMAQKNDRLIVQIAQNAASFAFLPL